MRDKPPDDEGPDGEPDEPGQPDEPDHSDEPDEGYAWTFLEQERGLPADEVRLHLEILDDWDEDDLEAFDPEGRSDYILWAAVQAGEETGPNDRTLGLLKRIAASDDPHPALDYPVIRLRLASYLRDRGDYAAALDLLERIEREDADLAAVCRERRAEVLVLSGDLKKGLWLFEKESARTPGDPQPAITAAWALLQRGEHGPAAEWAGRAARALERMEDDEASREAASEIERLGREIEERRRRSGRESSGGGSAAGRAPAPGQSPAAGGAPDLRRLRDAILAEVDAEEARLVDRPPRDQTARDGAAQRLAALYARASRAWDDAVEANDEEMIAAYDDLQSEIVGLAERFGVPAPAADED
jgi:tetratricopeptide (TPR) repeat protein